MKYKKILIEGEIKCTRCEKEALVKIETNYKIDWISENPLSLYVIGFEEVDGELFCRECIRDIKKEPEVQSDETDKSIKGLEST